MAISLWVYIPVLITAIILAFATRWLFRRAKDWRRGSLMGVASAILFLQIIVWTFPSQTIGA